MGGGNAAVGFAAVTEQRPPKMNDGRYHNLQSWENGRNNVRYIRPSQLRPVREAIANRERFDKLVQELADIIITETRQSLYPSARIKGGGES